MNLIKIDSLSKLTILLLILFPISIILSKFFSDLTVVIFTICCFIIRESFELGKNKKIYKNFFIVTFFLLVSFATFSSLISSNLAVTLKSSFFHYRFLFFIIFVSYLFTIETRTTLKYFFYVLVSCYILLLLDGTYQFIFKQNVFGYVTNPSTRVSSFFFDELVLGSFLSRLFPILVFLYIFLRFKVNIFYISLFLILLYFVTFISGERLSFLLLSIFYLLFFIFLFKSKLNKLIFLISFIIIFVLTINYSNNFNPRSSLTTITKQMANVNYTTCDETKEKIKSSGYLMNKWKYIPNCDPIFTIKGIKFYYIYSQMHFNHYISALEIFKDNVFFGVGPKNFRFICNEAKYFLNEFSCSTHPHNYMLQILAETGLFGIVFFTLIYFGFLFLFFKEIFNQNSEKSLLKLILISSILVNLFPLFPSGSFFNNWNSIIYSLPFGILLGYYRYSEWK